METIATIGIIICGLGLMQKPRLFTRITVIYVLLLAFGPVAYRYFATGDESLIGSPSRDPNPTLSRITTKRKIMKTFEFIPLDEIHPLFHLGLFLFGLIGMYLSYRRIAAIKSAEYMVANQFRTATETEIDHFVALSNTNGQKAAYLSELVKIRRAYGYSGVKLGHLVWIDMKINGTIQIDVDPPSFDNHSVQQPPDLLSNTVIIGKSGRGMSVMSKLIHTQKG